MIEPRSACRTAIVGTDPLVVMHRGLDGIEGRLLGSVPADATRRSRCDVPVVHPTG